MCSTLPTVVLYSHWQFLVPRTRPLTKGEFGDVSKTRKEHTICMRDFSNVSLKKKRQHYQLSRNCTTIRKGDFSYVSLRRIGQCLTKGESTNVSLKAKNKRDVRRNDAIEMQWNPSPSSSTAYPRQMVCHF